MELDLLEFFSDNTHFDASWHERIIKFSNIFLNYSIPQTGKINLNLYKYVLEILSQYQPDNWNAFIDGWDRGSILGWAKRIDSDDSQFISLDIMGKTVYECFLANALRPDVKDAGFGTGQYGFWVSTELSRCPFNFFFCSLREPFSKKIFAFRFFHLTEPMRNYFDCISK